MQHNQGDRKKGERFCCCDVIWSCGQCTVTQPIRRLVHQRRENIAIISEPLRAHGWSKDDATRRREARIHTEMRQYDHYDQSLAPRARILMEV
jgi:hypothetical protein